MANTLKLKRSAVAAKVPATTDLQLGELAVNTYDGKLYTKRNNGADEIVEFLSTASVLSVANGGTGATTLTGLIKGNGTSAFTAAVAGTDYVPPAGTGATGTWGISISGSAASLTTARTIGDTSFNGTANIDPSRIIYKDTRSTNYNPYTYLGVSLHLKENTADGLSDGGTYHGVLDLAHWSGTSGGVNHQLGLTDNGNLWIRASTGASSWGSWSQFVKNSGTWGISVSGNAATATQLASARNINGVAFDGSANILVPSLYSSDYRRITNPGGAEFVSASGNLTGAIQITLPVGYTNTMMRMTIKVFDYTTNESFDICCGGYNYAPGPTWAECFAYIVGNQTIDRRFNVRFGYTAGGKCCIYIGELASVWAYPQVFVTDVQLGYSGMSASWVSGWAISIQSSAFENVTITVAAAQVGYATSTNTASAVVLRDASGNFSAGTITANLAGNATTATTATNYSAIPSGTKMLFQQTSAPTGWTKDTTHNDKALRVVSGTASSGGSTAFSSVFASRTPAGTVGNTTLTQAQLAAHVHSTGFLQNSNTATTGAANRLGAAGSTVFIASDSVGLNSGHNHSFTGTAMDFAVQYVDLIIASKD